MRPAALVEDSLAVFGEVKAGALSDPRSVRTVLGGTLPSVCVRLPHQLQTVQRIGGSTLGRDPPRPLLLVAKILTQPAGDSVLFLVSRGADVR